LNVKEVKQASPSLREDKDWEYTGYCKCVDRHPEYGIHVGDGMGQFGAAVSAMDVSAMKCEMCFPLECHQSAKFALRSSGKRLSARVSPALVPDL